MFIATDGKDIYTIPEKGSNNLRVITKATARLPEYCFHNQTKTLFKVSVKRSEIILTKAEYSTDILPVYLNELKPCMKQQAHNFLTDAFPEAPLEEVDQAVETYCTREQIFV